MKRPVLILVLLASLVGGATWYGMKRSGDGSTRPEVSSQLHLAKKFIDGNDPARALKVLEDLEAQGYKVGERGAYIRVQALEKAGKHELANTAAREFLAEFTKSDYRPEIEVIQLSSDIALKSDGTAPKAAAKVEQFIQENPDHPGGARLQVTMARKELDAGNIAGATALLNEILKTRRTDEADVFELASAIGTANMQRLITGTREDDVVHTVVSGDSINRIANRNGATEELVMKINNITNPKALRIGQKIRVPKLNFDLLVDVSANTMILNNNGEFFKIYRVRTGRAEGATPNGTFKVLNKKRAPTWRPGNGYTYGPGDPNNELGTRWMAFEGDILGIHGTLHPDTIGHYASNGCVGLLTEEVEELFDIITVGTPLVIKGTQDLASHKVIPAPTVPPPREVASSN